MSTHRFSPVIAALHCQHPFAPEQVGPLLTQQPPQPLLQQCHVAQALSLNAHTADAAVVLVLLVLLQGTGFETLLLSGVLERSCS